MEQYTFSYPYEDIFSLTFLRLHCSRIGVVISIDCLSMLGSIKFTFMPRYKYKILTC